MFKYRVILSKWVFMQEYSFKQNTNVTYNGFVYRQIDEEKI